MPMTMAEFEKLAASKPAGQRLLEWGLGRLHLPGARRHRQVGRDRSGRLEGTLRGLTSHNLPDETDPVARLERRVRGMRHVEDRIKDLHFDVLAELIADRKPHVLQGRASWAPGSSHTRRDPAPR